MLRCAPSAVAATSPHLNLWSQSEDAFLSFWSERFSRFVSLYSSWLGLSDCSPPEKDKMRFWFLLYLLLWFGGSGPFFLSGFGRVSIDHANGIGMVMTIRHVVEPDRHKETRKSGFGDHSKSAETLGFPRSNLGQLYPQDYPHPEVANGDAVPNPLGDAIGIAEVAELLGCSPWTVRQRYMLQGLPHMRASARGRLVFFRSQVIGWILKRQQKGGK